MDRGPHRRDRICVGRRKAASASQRSPPNSFGCKVDVIVTSGTANVVAAKQATSVIPIVFAVAGDPIANNIVASLARPGGNITGLSTVATDLAGKRVELLREAVPGFRRLAMIGNIGNPSPGWR